MVDNLVQNFQIKPTNSEVMPNFRKTHNSYRMLLCGTVEIQFSKKMDRPKPLAKLEKFAKTEQLANFKNHEILHLIFENFQMFSTHQIEVCTSYLLSL